jgi:hypothetical protein
LFRISNPEPPQTTPIPDLRARMHSLSDIQLLGVATHYVGNSAAGDNLQLSKNLIDLENAELKQVLLQYFLSPFQETASYHLWHPADIKLNEVHHFVTEIFADPENLMLQSCNLARHLYDITTLPQIKSGELTVAYFKGCPVDGRMTDAVGIYKTESKSKYLKLSEGKEGYNFQAEEGIDPNRMDKGCLIFNVRPEEGYRVHVLDRTAKGGEAQFWKDTFLKIRAAADEYHATEDYIKLCKNFIEEQIPNEFEVERVQQIQLLNKAAAYFKQNEQFEQDSFTEEVFDHPELRESFKKYEKQYQRDYEVKFQDSFEISSPL